MKEIVKDILKIMEESNMSIYSLAKTSGINKSTLYKTMQFERNLTPKHFYKILDCLPTSLSEKNKLAERFQALNKSKNEYSLQDKVLTILRNIFNADCSISAPEIRPPQIERLAEEYKTVKGSSVATAINLALIEEMNCNNPEVYIYIPGDKPLILTNIDSTIKTYNTNIKINFLLDFLSGASESCISGNLDIIKNIIPMIASGSKNYSFYYTYTKNYYDESIPIQYPFFISCSKSVIYINYNLDEAAIVRSHDIVNNQKNYCKSRLVHYNLLNMAVFSHLEMVTEFNENQQGFNSFYAVEYDPCYLSFVTEEMAEELLRKEVPMREMFMTLVQSRIEQLRALSRSIQIFNASAIMEFAENGRLNITPRSFIKQFSYEQRLYLIKSSYEIAKGDAHFIRAANPNIIFTPNNMSISIQNDGFLQIATFDQVKPAVNYVLLTEPSVCNAFLSFFSHIGDHNLVFSKEETLALYERAIDYLEDKINNR